MRRCPSPGVPAQLHTWQVRTQATACNTFQFPFSDSEPRTSNMAMGLIPERPIQLLDWRVLEQLWPVCVYVERKCLALGWAVAQCGFSLYGSLNNKFQLHSQSHHHHISYSLRRSSQLSVTSLTAIREIRESSAKWWFINYCRRYRGRLVWASVSAPISHWFIVSVFTLFLSHG